MNKILIGLLISTSFLSCSGNSSNKTDQISSIAKVTDSIKQKKAIDSAMALGDRSDSEEGDLSFDEVKKNLLSKYDKISHIDTLVILGKDSLHIHEKYYCLKDNGVVVPKKYLWGGDKSKDFVTHNFVSNIIIIKSSDTLINQTFRVKDFANVINSEERKYAILFSRSFNGYSDLYEGLVFGYSITIPLTDVGVAAYVVIDNNGKYKTVNDYDMINKIKK